MSPLLAVLLAAHAMGGAVGGGTLNISSVMVNQTALANARTEQWFLLHVMGS